MPIPGLLQDDRHLPQRAHHQRSRYESTISRKSSDPTCQSGPMCKRGDCRATTNALMSLREEQGSTNTFVQKKYEDQAEKHIGPSTSTKSGMAQPKLEDVLLRTNFVLFVVMVTKVVATRRHLVQLDAGWRTTSVRVKKGCGIQM